jgi:hypothetical protein
MPMFGPDGVSIMLCPGWDGGATSVHHTMAMNGGHTERASHDPEKSDDPTSDHPCAFSVVAGSDPEPFAPAIAPRESRAEILPVRGPIFWTGRSPSAPPPPSTGPPIPA